MSAPQPPNEPPLRVRAPAPALDPSPDLPAASRPSPESGGDRTSRSAQTDESGLSLLERAQIRLVQRSLRPGIPDRVIRVLQRTVGQAWIRAATARIRHVHGLSRLPPWDPAGSIVCVANHRSFFDLYVTTAVLVAHGLPQRILFPVRSNFFYDHPLGPVVNAAMSFFAMYPPIFRDRRRAALNLRSLDELAGLLRRGGFFVGMHPEGRRNRGDDPYALLPAQAGVGRVIQKARVPVVPVFVNGLVNDLPAQIAGGITGKGTPIHIVFGAPIDFRGLLDLPDSPRAHRQIAERCLEAIETLGAEERRIRGGQQG